MSNTTQNTAVEAMPNLDIGNFQGYSSCSDSDRLLMVINGSDGSVAVGVMKAQLSADIKPSIENGTWHIGKVDTGIEAVGKSPEFRTSSDGIEWRYVDSADWISLVGYDELRMKLEDLTPEQFQALKLTLADLTPEELFELQQPATDMIDALTLTNTTAVQAESSRADAESNRSMAEDNRSSAETTRAASETNRSNEEVTRVANETTRKTAEQGRVNSESMRSTDESNRKANETARVTAEGSRQTAEQERYNAELVRITKELERISGETTRVGAEGERAEQFIKLAQDLAKAISSANHVPYVGADNYIYEWDEATQNYNKSSKYVKGDTFSITKTYTSVALMEADFTGTDTKEGDFVLINTNDVQDPDNSKLYAKGATQWGYMVDMSGAMGFVGKTPQFSAGTITILEPEATASVSLSPDGEDADGNPKFKLNLAMPRGAKGEGLDYSTMTEVEKANIKGNSAYQDAVATGAFVGTLAEYLASLKGNKGTDGTAAGFGTPTYITNTVEPDVPANVVVEAHGSNTEKIFKFTFDIPKGAQGAKGEKGDTGAAGTPGAQGAKGEKGAAGSNGSNGISADYQWSGTYLRMYGASGWSAFVNLQGNTGAQGAKGEKGDTGAAGTPGAQGAKGEKGDTGAAGKDATFNSSGSYTTSGTFTASNFIISSDIKLKTDIKPFDRCSVLDIKAKTFTLYGEERIGYIAQDVEAIDPIYVSEFKQDGNTYKALDYVGILVAKIEELTERVLKTEETIGHLVAFIEKGGRYGC